MGKALRRRSPYGRSLPDDVVASAASPRTVRQGPTGEVRPGGDVHWPSAVSAPGQATTRPSGSRTERGALREGAGPARILLIRNKEDI